MTGLKQGDISRRVAQHGLAIDGENNLSRLDLSAKSRVKASSSSNLFDTFGAD